MLISLIAAVDQKGGIGRENRLPWHLSDDLKHFRRLTMGHHVLMGRKTYQSSQGKMPGRKLIVLSHNLGFQPADALVVTSLDAGIQFARSAGETELFVIGGAQVFAQALPIAQRLYYTEVTPIPMQTFSSPPWIAANGKKYPAKISPQVLKMITPSRSFILKDSIHRDESWLIITSLQSLISNN